jgi:hypothetical protein
MPGRPALHKMQEIMGENAVEIGQQHLRFVRRGVCCCSAVARESSLDTVALLGRFLPRLGPLPQGERPFFFSGRFGCSRKVSGAFLLSSSTFFISAFFISTARRRRTASVLSKPIRLPPPDRGAILPAEFPRAGRQESRIQQRAARTMPPAGSGARPYTAPG